MNYWKEKVECLQCSAYALLEAWTDFYNMIIRFTVIFRNYLIMHADILASWLKSLIIGWIYCNSGRLTGLFWNFPSKVMNFRTKLWNFWLKVWHFLTKICQFLNKNQKKFCQNSGFFKSLMFSEKFSVKSLVFSEKK